jgi:hypothetical protein
LSSILLPPLGLSKPGELLVENLTTQSTRKESLLWGGLICLEEQIWRRIWLPECKENRLNYMYNNDLNK